MTDLGTYETGLFTGRLPRPDFSSKLQKRYYSDMLAARHVPSILQEPWLWDSSDADPLPNLLV